MKAITVRQPWASLIAHGVKTIETRPGPPNGPMRPEGLRGLPGLAVERGERIAIHASAAHHVGAWPWGLVDAVDDLCGFANYPDALPLGVVVATAIVSDALPIVAERECADYPAPEGGMLTISRPGHPIPSLTRFVWKRNAWSLAPTLYQEDHQAETGGRGRSDQIPLGDFTPGRWGWLLTDVRRIDPVPCKGRQGVWDLGYDLSEKVAIAEATR